jgi:hypothetical protein
MKVEMSPDGENAAINAEFPSAYKKIETLMMAGKAAAEKQDVETLHQIHGQILGAAIDLQNASFFGLAVKQIDAMAKSQAKAQAESGDMPDNHPV